MKYAKPALFALLAAVAFTAPAFAQMEGVAMRDSSMMMVGKDGRMTTIEMKDKAMMEMVMKEGKVVSGSQIFVMSGGKMYMLEDHKMPDGRMLSQHMGFRG